MNSNGVITKPVRMLADVRSVLGETANSLSALCKSSKINKFSLHKPYAFNTFSPLTDEERTSMNCGMEYKMMNLGFNSSSRSAPTWGQWSPPKGKYTNNVGGTVYEPYRLGDFNGYDHKALPFITKVEIYTSHLDRESLICSTTRDGYLFVNVYTNWDSYNRRNITFADFKHSNGTSFKNYYLCVALVPLHGAIFHTEAAIYAFSEPLGQHSGNFMFTLQTAPNEKLLQYAPSINDDVILIIGIVDKKSPLPQQGDFFSPVVFPEFASYPWLTQYNTYKANDGGTVWTDYYFKSGFGNPQAELAFNNNYMYPQVELYLSTFINSQQTNSSGQNIAFQSVRMMIKIDGQITYSNGSTEGFVFSSDAFDVSASDEISNKLMGTFNISNYGLIKVEFTAEILGTSIINTTSGIGTRWNLLGSNGSYPSKQSFTEYVNVPSPY